MARERLEVWFDTFPGAFHCAVAAHAATHQSRHGALGQGRPFAASLGGIAHGTLCLLSEISRASGSKLLARYTPI